MGRDASTQRRDSVALFSLDEVSGNATLMETTSTQGWYPRSMALDLVTTSKQSMNMPRLLLVANQKSNDVFSFHADGGTGKLKPTGKSTGPLPDAAAFVAFA